MKKLTVLTLLVIGSLITNGQSTFGLLAGPQSAEFYKGHDRDNGYKINPRLGVYFAIPLSHTFSLSTELVYSPKGTLINYKDTVGRRYKDQFRMNLKYAEVPLELQAKISKWLYLHAGGYAGYLVDMNITSPEDYEYVITHFNEDNFYRWDLGYKAGFTLDLYGILIDVSAERGQKDIGKPGRPLGTWESNGQGNTAFRNKTYFAVAKIPFSLKYYNKHKLTKKLIP